MTIQKILYNFVLIYFTTNQQKMFPQQKIRPEPVLDEKSIREKRTIKVEMQIYKIVPSAVKGVISAHVWSEPIIKYVTKKALTEMKKQPNKYRVTVLDGLKENPTIQMPTISTAQLREQIEAELRAKIKAELLAEAKKESENLESDTEVKKPRKQKDSFTTELTN